MMLGMLGAVIEGGGKVANDGCGWWVKSMDCELGSDVERNEDAGNGG